jgi:hypothetical protein
MADKVDNSGWVAVQEGKPFATHKIRITGDIVASHMEIREDDRTF